MRPQKGIGRSQKASGRSEVCTASTGPASGSAISGRSVEIGGDQGRSEEITPARRARGPRAAARRGVDRAAEARPRRRNTRRAVGPSPPAPPRGSGGGRRALAAPAALPLPARQHQKCEQEQRRAGRPATRAPPRPAPRCRGGAARRPCRPRARPARRASRRPAEATRGKQTQSEAIRRNQTQSEGDLQRPSGRPCKAVEVMDGRRRPWKAVEGRGRRWTAVDGTLAAMDGRGRSWKVVEGQRTVAAESAEAHGAQSSREVSTVSIDTCHGRSVEGRWEVRGRFVEGHGKPWKVVEGAIASMETFCPCAASGWSARRSCSSSASHSRSSSSSASWSAARAAAEEVAAALPSRPSIWSSSDCSWLSPRSVTRSTTTVSDGTCGRSRRARGEIEGRSGRDRGKIGRREQMEIGRSARRHHGLLKPLQQLGRNQTQQDATRRNQTQSDAIRRHHGLLKPLQQLGRNQTQSDAIRRNQTQSEGTMGS